MKKTFFEIVTELYKKYELTFCGTQIILHIVSDSGTNTERMEALRELGFEMVDVVIVGSSKEKLRYVFSMDFSDCFEKEEQTFVTKITSHNTYVMSISSRIAKLLAERKKRLAYAAKAQESVKAKRQKIVDNIAQNQEAYKKIFEQEKISKRDIQRAEKIMTKIRLWSSRLQ